MRIGSRALAALLLASLAVPGAGPQSGGKNRTKQQESYSVVAGTVFREPGFALPDAEVTLTPAAEDGSPAKGRKMTFTCNTRGEFAFRVPSAKARFVLTAVAKGMQRQERSVEVHPDDRIDVTFMLVPESNK